MINKVCKRTALWGAAIGSVLLAALLCFAGIGGGATAVAAENKLDDFAEDFESYQTGGYIEQTETFADKWSNNVLRGGEAQGMDAHLREKARVSYQTGTNGNKVLAVNNTSGADTFFYIGPKGDFRVKNFTAEMKVRFLTEGVAERSWVGFSVRKKNNVHYTGTNNMVFFVQRYKANAQITGHAVVIQNGGAAADISDMYNGGLYGEKLTLSRETYTVPGVEANEDFADFVNVKLVVNNKRYVLYADDTAVLDCTFDIPLYDYFGYVSINCCTSNIQIDDVKITVADDSLPPVIPMLSTPEITNDAAAKKITWKRVPDADGYRIAYGDKSEIVYATSFSYEKLPAGEYDVTVTALPVDSFEHRESEPSEAVRITVGGTASGGEKKGCGSSVGATAVGGGIVLACGAAALLCVRRKRIKA